MRAVRYGKVPIGIYRINYPKGRKNDRIVLVYLYVYPDGNQVICQLDSRTQRYVHLRISKDRFDTFIHRSTFVALPYDVALQWLQRYCRHFKRTNWQDFDIRTSMKYSTVHYALKEGADECPCKEIFSMREQARNASRLQR